MTFTEAAAQVLRLVGKPLHYKEITDVAIEKNLLSHVGKSPEVTMGARLAALVKKGEKDNPLVRIKPGVFALKEWDQKVVDQGLADRTPALEILASKGDEEPVVASVAEDEESEPAADESALDESAVEEMPPPDEDEQERAQMRAAASDIFEAEEDDDEPIFGAPASEEDDGERDDEDGEGRGRRRRRRRRRGRGERDEKAGDDLPSYTVSDAPADSDVPVDDEPREREVREGRSRSRGRDRDRDNRDRDSRDRDRDSRDRDRDRDSRDRDRDRDGRDRDRDRDGRDRDVSIEGLAGAALADALDDLLGGYDRGASGISAHKLADSLQRRGRGGEGNHLASLLLATARADNLRRQDAGLRPRFRVSNNRIALTEWLLDGELLRLERDVAQIVDRYREVARRSLLRRVQELPHRAVGELVLLVLERAGLSAVELVRRPGTPNSELHLSGVQTGPGGEMRVAIVVRRDGREVGRERVTELRGSLHHYGPAHAGWLITTGQVLSGAREEAGVPGAAPVTLIDGHRLAQLCEEYGVGVVPTRISLAVPDGELFEALRSG